MDLFRNLRMMQGTPLHILFLLTTAAVAAAVGPDLKARARLLRDLPMGFGGVDAIPPKERDRYCMRDNTLITKLAKSQGKDHLAFF